MGHGQQTSSYVYGGIHGYQVVPIDSRVQYLEINFSSNSRSRTSGGLDGGENTKCESVMNAVICSIERFHSFFYTYSSVHVKKTLEARSRRRIVHRDP